MVEAKKPAVEGAPSNPHFDVRMPRYSLWRRMQIPIIAGTISSVMRMLGPTLRFEILGQQHADRVYAQKRRMVWAFYHCGILGIMWWARHRGIGVLNSTNFDGQWSGRVIERFGFASIPGSSTRGGLRGMAILAQRLEQGQDAAFTVDGPRGPRFVAKPGPVMLARHTGYPIGAFHVGYDHALTVKSSWDQLRVPRPFTRVVIAFAPPIEVPSHADRSTVEAKQVELQSELERARHLAESWFTLSPEEQARQRKLWNT
jgi:lysophospholipid acyltransferase (LPLAT)-like uncharacterized protein